MSIRKNFIAIATALLITPSTSAFSGEVKPLPVKGSLYVNDVFKSIWSYANFNLRMKAGGLLVLLHENAETHFDCNSGKITQSVTKNNFEQVLHL